MKPSEASEQTIFDAARQIPDPQARAAYLASACAGSLELPRRIEALLNASLRADQFLAGDPLELGEVSRKTTMPGGVSEGPGTVIDKYKLLEKLGEGGFGAVYMAEQTQPVKRRVALKIIKVGMDTREVVARFEAERQALALMDHPNIAKVLDGGVTDTGRPYFVMELVRGTRITEYCDERNLSTRERLDLFTKVCQAVQHAHQKGIIHRDLKPSNILVTVNDGVPVPKIIDFGIAKATQMELTEKTVFTRFQQFIGTPAYMSPEQAAMTSLDIDTRSDIYSLGVLLYELLTSRTPFDASELLKAGLDEMRRTIRETEPARPSTRLSTLGGDELTTTAKRRGLEPPRLISQLRGDLDWIVMKCLEKDRAHRYETANGLAMDIQRHLNSEPVVAGPPSRLYRFQKLIRRNRVLAASTAVVSVVLVLGAIVSTWQAIRATRAEREQSRLRREAQAAQANEKNERERAQTEAAKSQQVAQFLKDMLQGVGPSKALGRDTTMLREILDKTAERVGKDLTNQPEVEVELRNVLAATYGELGLDKKEEEMAEVSFNLARAKFGQESPIAAQALELMAETQREQGNLIAAEGAQREVLRVRRKVFGDQSPEVAASLNSLGLTLYYRGEMAEAESQFRQALAVQRKARGEESEDVATSLNNLGLCLQGLGRMAEAEAAYRGSLAVKRKIWGNEHPELAVTLNNLGVSLQAQGKLTEAETVAREALAMERKLFGNDHQNVAYALSTLGRVLLGQGKLAEAEAAQREALEMRRKLLGEDHVAVASSLNDLAHVLSEERKLTQAEAVYREVLVIARKRLGDENVDVATTLNSLALNLQQQGKSGEAEPICREALAMRRKLLGESHPDVGASIQTLVGVLREEGKLAEAEILCREALAAMRAKLSGDDPEVAGALYRLATVLIAEGNSVEAEPLVRESLAIREKKLPDHWLTFRTQSLLGTSLLGQQRYAQAEPLLLSGYEGMKQREGSIPKRGRSCLNQAVKDLVQLYDATSQTNQATRWKKTLEDFDRTQTNRPAANPPP